MMEMLKFVRFSFLSLYCTILIEFFLYWYVTPFYTHLVRERSCLIHQQCAVKGCVNNPKKPLPLESDFIKQNFLSKIQRPLDFANRQQEILILYSESVPSFFFNKPNHSELIPWSEVLQKIISKISTDNLNDKYDVLSEQGKPRIKTQSIEKFVTSSASEIVDYFFDQYCAPVIICIGINAQSVKLAENPKYYLILQQLTKAASAVRCFDCDDTISRFEKFGSFSPLSTRTTSPALNTTVKVLQEYWNVDPNIESSVQLLEGPNEGQKATIAAMSLPINAVKAVVSALPGSSLFQSPEQKLELSLQKRHVHAYEIIQEMWKRKSLDDLLFGFYVLLDTFAGYPIKSVQSVTSTESTSFSNLLCMIKNCRMEMIKCFMNERCRKALNCLNQCKGNDQVCSYRCITSYESPEFEQFAFCILQKNNCMRNKATIPKYPDPSPLAMFRGKPLDFETADDILIGHLELLPGQINHFYQSAPPIASETHNSTTITAAKPLSTLLPWSWKVVCGQNPAYDYFACQYQLFYRDPNNTRILWYDPIFRVTTIDGHEVWRRRHYRVKRGKIPGQYYFSDNGVASNEFWRLLDCADDLSWAVLYYAGAASAAGTSYTGSLLVTPTGRWPEQTVETMSRITHALAKGEISRWELFEVHNENCSEGEPPPLQLDYHFPNLLRGGITVL